MLLEVDRVLGRERYGTTDRHRHESPGENEEKGVYNQNGGWDNIVWTCVPAHESIRLRSSINNPKDSYTLSRRANFLIDNFLIDLLFRHGDFVGDGRVWKTQPGGRGR